MNPRDIECKRCGARPNQRCFNMGTARPMKGFHKERMNPARKPITRNVDVSSALEVQKRMATMSFPRRVTITDSSNLLSVMYDPDDKLMIVTFNNGATYEYEEVSPVDFGNLISADSVGKTFNKLVHKWNAKRL